MEETVLAAVILLLGSCEKIDVGRGRSRLDCFPDRYGLNVTVRPGGGTGTPLPPGEAIDKLECDTLIYVSGVDFPEGYDWQRDTSYGQVDAHVVLYRNGERILNIATGRDVSTAADRHYLMEGHLFTEAVHGDETVIGMDGGRLFSISGREVLKGLALQGGDVYTLSQKIGGAGFSLRKNGEEIMTREDGKVLGDLNGSPFYRSGALHMDGRKLCFAYSSGEEGQRSWFLVADGTETPLTLPENADEVNDIRSIGGKVHIVFWDDKLRTCHLMCDGLITVLDGGGRGYRSRNVCIGPCGKSYLTMGMFAKGNQGNWPQACWGPEEGFRPIGNPGFVFTKNSLVSTLGMSEDGVLTISPARHGEKRFSGYSRWFLPSFRIGHQTDDPLFLALTPCDEGRRPFIWDGEKASELDMNGFLTAVEVCLVPKEQ